MNNKTNKFWNFLVMFLLIGTSAFPFFKDGVITYVIIFTVPLIWYIFVLKKQHIDKYFVYIVLLFIVLHFGQTIFNKLFTGVTFLGLYLRFFYAYLSIKILKEKFVPTFTRVLYTLSVVGLFIYVAASIFPVVYSILDNIANYTLSPFVSSSEAHDKQIIIYNFSLINRQHLLGMPRNSGAFWEPGAYAGYLIIGIYFNLLRNKSFFNKENNIFILSLLTTFSTTGYIAFFVLYSLYGFFLKKNKTVGYFGAFLVIMLSIYSYQHFEFLGVKIEEQIYRSKLNKYSGTRFSTAILDLETFMQNPVFGKGRNREMKYGETISKEESFVQKRNNGITILLSTYGIFYFIIYFYFINKSFNNMSIYYVNKRKNIGKLFILILFIIGFSQPYFLAPFFYALPMLLFVYKT